MKQLKRTKKMLITSVISLVLCLSMLFGTTLAWFTDSISVNANIDIGSLNAALEKSIDGEYKNIGTKEGNGAYTESDKTVFTETGWIPGQTEVYFLAVRNEGQIALNYQIEIILSGELTGALEYAIIDGVQDGTEAATVIQNAADQCRWDTIQNYVGVQTGAVQNGTLQAAPNGFLEVEEANYFALLMHLREDAENSYQGKAFSAEVAVNAYQDTYVAPEPEVPDPFEDYTVALLYDFENGFTFGNYAATTGIGAYAPNSTITVAAEGENHYGRMTRIWTESSRPETLSGVSSPRIQFNELAAAVEGEDIVVLSFDIRQFINDSFASFSIDGLKLNNDQVTVCFKEADTPVTLVDLSDDEWHNVMVVYDRTEGTIRYYGDHVLLNGVEGSFTGTGFSSEGYLRFQIDPYGYPKLTDEDLVGDNDFGIDNFMLRVPTETTDPTPDPEPEPEPVVDPFANYFVKKIYDFENSFTLGAYNATTGVGAYKGGGSSIFIGEETSNHYVEMKRVYTDETRPDAFAGAFRIQLNEIYDDVLTENVVVYSFDIKELVDGGFSSLGFKGLKYSQSKVWVCLAESDTPVVLVDLSDDAWHNVAVEIDYQNNTMKYYGDGVVSTVTTTAMPIPAEGSRYLRIQVDTYNYPKIPAADQTNDIDFGIDNFKVMVPPTTE